MSDPRRAVPRTDAVLADPRLVALAGRLGRERVKAAVGDALNRVRAGEIPAASAADAALDALPSRAGSARAVLNATGVVLHTNLGRAALSAAARVAVAEAAGYVDVEFDLGTGRRAPRGRGMLDALRRAVPAAEDVLVVNNGAAALLLATTVLAGGTGAGTRGTGGTSGTGGTGGNIGGTGGNIGGETRREVVVSRGELVEIGDGFRLPDLIVSTGARLREVGTTNRTNLADYAAAVGAASGAILKVHPSNFRVQGFTSSVPVHALAGLGVAVLVDIGSGLLAPHPLLPDEPDAATALADGASLVTCSADKLLGGPQAGLLLGRHDVVEQARRHPLARALRVDKLTVAALEATLDSPTSPTWDALLADPAALRRRAAALAEAVGGVVVAAAGAVGGGGAPGLVLSGWAVALPAELAAPLRAGDPPVVGRIEHDRLLLDLRCIPSDLDATVAEAIRRCTG